jgi:dihydroflavonol-4-reductase
LSLSLITGGSGFIGQHLSAALVARGTRVRILDIDVPRRSLPGVDFVRGSILDGDAVRGAMDGVDCVYHLAGIAHLWAEREGALDCVNAYGTEIVLSAARAKGIARLVHCSSETVLLGPHATSIVDESVSLSPGDLAGPYSRSKFRAEEMVRVAAAGGLNAVIVNPSLPVGPGDDHFTPPAAMLAHFLDARLQIYLDCTMNLVDVRDVAQGMLRAAEHGRRGERYILGGTDLRLSELLDCLASLTGRRAARLALPKAVAMILAAACETAAQVTQGCPLATREGVRLALRAAPLSSEKARRELGYMPRPIEPALADFVDWMVARAEAASRNAHGEDCASATEPGADKRPRADALSLRGR